MVCKTYSKSAGDRDVIEHSFGVNTKARADLSDTLRTERALRVDVHNLAIAAARGSGKLGGHAQGMTQPAVGDQEGVSA